ncbi:MAG TPA: hypothetical protein VF677_11915 [Flavobacterium sp.]|jgi:hypothetical protein
MKSIIIKSLGGTMLKRCAQGIPFTEKFYLWLVSFVSGVLAYYTDLHLAFYIFLGATTLDTITSIHVDAVKKGLKFNPFRGYFWKQITSGGLREWAKKVFLEYGIYLIIAFMINEWVLKRMVLFEVFDRKLTLPVIALYLFSFIEIWSIGENIEKAGGTNLFKKILHFLPDKYQQIFKNENNG